MRHTKQIIEDAIEGGWNPRPEDAKPQIVVNPTEDEHGQIFTIFRTHFNNNSRTFTLFAEQMLLSADFWRAVGVTRDWSYPLSESYGFFNGEWAQKQNKFINYVHHGDSYETALSKLNHPN